MRDFLHIEGAGITAGVGSSFGPHLRDAQLRHGVQLRAAQKTGAQREC